MDMKMDISINQQNLDHLHNNCWDELYRKGETPWSTGRASTELTRVIRQGWIKPCRVLELGCGTGTDAVFLASQGFQVTAVDLSIQAIQEAVIKADQAKAQVRFCWADLLQLPTILRVPYDLVYDRGCYHYVRMYGINEYLKMLESVTRPDSQFLLLAGSGPSLGEQSYSPINSEDEIRNELDSLFDFKWIHQFNFDVTSTYTGPSAWSCLMSRILGSLSGENESGE